MWIILGLSIPLFGMGLFMFLNRRRRVNLSASLIKELRQGLPLFEVEGEEGAADSGIIRVKHVFGTWFIHAIELSRNATLYILRPPQYQDEYGEVVYPEAPIKRVVDSPGAARRLGEEMVRAVRDANDALRVVMSFTPDPRYS